MPEDKNEAAIAASPPHSGDTDKSITIDSNSADQTDGKKEGQDEASSSFKSFLVSRDRALPCCSHITDQQYSEYSHTTIAWDGS